jgi:hypothetical protein
LPGKQGSYALVSIECYSSRDQERLTLQELLTSVLLVKGLVDDGASKIINHQEEDWLNLLFRVASVV